MYDFTVESSKWLNKFIRDVALNKEKVIKKVESFPGDKEIVLKALEKGPGAFGPKDVDACKTLFNFVEFYSTDRVSKVEVKVHGE